MSEVRKITRESRNAGATSEMLYEQIKFHTFYSPVVASSWISLRATNVFVFNTPSAFGVSGTFFSNARCQGSRRVEFSCSK